MHATCASPLIAAQSRGIAVPGATRAVVVAAGEEFVAALVDASDAPCALTAAHAAIDIAATSVFNGHCLMLPPHFALMKRADARRKAKGCTVRATIGRQRGREGALATPVGKRR
jgi:hypothetical protein